jgi:hypothetical protein
MHLAGQILRRARVIADDKGERGVKADNIALFWEGKDGVAYSYQAMFGCQFFLCTGNFGAIAFLQ